MGLSKEVHPSPTRINMSYQLRQDDGSDFTSQGILEDWQIVTKVVSSRTDDSVVQKWDSHETKAITSDRSYQLL